jgi:hypothetical protein
LTPIRTTQLGNIVSLLAFHTHSLFAPFTIWPCVPSRLSPVHLVCLSSHSWPNPHLFTCHYICSPLCSTSWQHRGVDTLLIFHTTLARDSESISSSKGSSRLTCRITRTNNGFPSPARSAPTTTVTIVANLSCFWKTATWLCQPGISNTPERYGMTQSRATSFV